MKNKLIKYEIVRGEKTETKRGRDAYSQCMTDFYTFYHLLSFEKVENFNSFVVINHYRDNDGNPVDVRAYYA